jgi:class 3 adenylate cyclase
MSLKPQTRFAKTSDGVSVGYSVTGTGVPLLFSFPIGHQTLMVENPVLRPWFEGLARRYQLVVFDSRGNGLSQRDVTWSPEAFALDLEAVVNALSLTDVFVFAPIGYGHGAIRYALAHPDRMAGLILWASFVNGATALEPTHILNLAEQNWEFFLQTIPSSLHWLEPSQIRAYVDMLRQSSTQRDYLSFIRACLESDIETLLPAVQTPALVLHPRELDQVKVDEAMRLASMLPNARLVLLEGPRLFPTGEAIEPALAAIAEFVSGITGRTEDHPAVVAGSAFRTILFTDIVGHTEMMQRLGDAKGRDLLREHERITRELLKAHGGAEVKTMGDGFMASFGSVTSAMDCAIALQRAFAAHTDSMPEPLHVRVGLNAGEPIEEDGDLFGATVILASRIAAKAGADEILIPEPVRHLLSGKTFVFSDRGEYEMKGFDDAVRLYEVRWREPA